MGAERYRHMRGSVSTSNYRFVWSPKYRRTVLMGAVAQRLKERLHELATDLHCTGTALDVRPDFGHLFVDCPPVSAPQQRANQGKATPPVCCALRCRTGVRVCRRCGAVRTLSARPDTS